MNEQQIEAKAERMVDKVDARYLDGEMSEAEYDAAIAAIQTWADTQIQRVPK